MLSGIKKSIGLTVAALLVFSGCTGLVKSLAAISALQNGLHRKYHDEVRVTLGNSVFLSVAFINSPLNNNDSKKRFERAQDAARFVSLNFADIRSINQIWISFVAEKREFIFYQERRVLEGFAFDRNGAQLPDYRSHEPPTDTTSRNNTFTSSDDPRATVIRFNDNANLSDISITRIQLEGNMQKGIALVPHFLVAGDARPPAEKTPPPTAVDLDIASYSDQPLFAENTKIEISCDGQLAANGLLRLRPTQDSGTDMSIAQFLSAQISFRVFRRMANARRVSIVLGSKRFELMPDDIEALSRMASYVVDK
jgi:hypothetical protein